MEEESMPRKKGKPSIEMMAFALLLVLGIIIGIYASQFVEEFVFPQKYRLAQDAQSLRTQNQLLKERVDCLNNAIQENRGKAGLTECSS